MKIPVFEIRSPERITGTAWCVAALNAMTPSWAEAADEKRLAFLTVMEGRMYGNDPLLDAWGWFSKGYDAK